LWKKALNCAFFIYFKKLILLNVEILVPYIFKNKEGDTMKLCTLWGDMSADRASDQYPQANVCDDCINNHADSENSPIVSVNGSYDSSYGEECTLCDAHISEE
jgi:hypothetical protein